ncbi:MAG: hypothetical protein V1706_08450 [Pseudomonadota bacterium]
MIEKKILLGAGGGAIALSIAVAVTINIVINDGTDSQPATGEQLSCTELQQAVDDIGRPGFDLLPRHIKEAIGMQDNTCNVTGKDWSIVHGQVHRQTDNTIIGDERSILEDFK